MARAYLKVPFEFIDQTINLSQEEREQLLLGMLTYASSGVEPKLEGGAHAIWPMMQRIINRQTKAYEAKVNNGRLGGRPPIKK